MRRCRLCLVPDTRPDTVFVEGVCSACITYARRPGIDWAVRASALLDLLERHRRVGAEFDCVVASSGGKDSHAQVLRLIELGARPLIVTATPCHPTELGQQNVANLERYATTIRWTPNRTIRARINRAAFELVGDPSWPEHVSIFTAPFRIAAAMGITLVFYGENPQAEYGGPLGTEDARQMTDRWVAEFGGLLGLRARDLVGQAGIRAEDMLDYTVDPEHIVKAGVEAHFLGAYWPWDSRENAALARDAGMQARLPSEANWWQWENLDNAQTGLHDYAGYRKYGYGRAVAQLSVDIRHGRIDRSSALALARIREGKFPYTYAGVQLQEILQPMALDMEKLSTILDRHTDWKLFEPQPQAPGSSIRRKAFLPESAWV